MLLGSSSAAINKTADVGDAVNGSGSQVGIPYSEELIAFTEAAHRLDETLPNARQALARVVGENGMVDAAVTASIFRSLNIAADASGIRIDDHWEEIAADLATQTSANQFPTAANSPKVEDLVDAMQNNNE